MTTCTTRPGSKRVRSAYRLKQARRRLGSEPLWLAGLLLTGALVIFLFNVFGSVPTSLSASWASLSNSQGRAHSSYPVYPYSVIMGGAHSPEELRTALRQDRVAAAHYAGFHLSPAHMVVSQTPRLMYTSYRKNGAVYWTNHPVHIAAGETLLTDGSNWARARCGNRLSDTPQTPTAVDEPAEEDMDHPVQTNSAEAPQMVHPSDLPHPRLAFEIFPPLVAANTDNEPLGSTSDVVSEKRLPVSAAQQSAQATGLASATPDLLNYSIPGLPPPTKSGVEGPPVDPSFTLEATAAASRQAAAVSATPALPPFLLSAVTKTTLQPSFFYTAPQSGNNATGSAPGSSTDAALPLGDLPPGHPAPVELIPTVESPLLSSSDPAIPPPATTPEPAPALLALTSLSAIFWRLRRR